MIVENLICSKLHISYKEGGSFNISSIKDSCKDEDLLKFANAIISLQSKHTTGIKKISTYKLEESKSV